MVRIAQITDTHLLANIEDDMRGVKTWYSLQKVLAEVQEYQPDCLIFTGDLAHEGEQEAYRHLMDFIQSIQIPSYWLAGNHDDPQLMSEILKGKYLHKDKSVSFKNWQLLLLDSFLENPEYGEGKISDAQLTWLMSELEQHSEKFVAIALHHHVVLSGIDWLDQINVINSSEFWQIVMQYPQVQTVFFGHMHLELEVQVNHVKCFGTPATCTQVTPPNYEVNPHKIQYWQQPGFRLFDLEDDGIFKTKVHRIQWFT